MTVAADAHRIGETVGGKYRIVRLLARGGMGVVYEAHHAVVRRRFALKFLRRDLAERRDILSRFQREAEAAGALENDNVTAAVDFGISDDGAPFIVMEYLVGESLADLLLREGRLPVHRAVDLVAQACRGVEAAHVAGIVHRDLKPHNLFVTRRDDGTDLVKVLDFGVAKLQAFDEATAATGTGTILGTAAYMSPEQARGEKAVDKRTDIYALGAILFEILSQKMPHPGDSPNAILHHIATQPAVPLDSLRADLPPELVAIVGRTLTSDPAARPASAGGLAQELAAFARREVWPAAPDLETPAAGGAESKSSTFNDRRGTPPPAPRRPFPAARVALGGAVLVAAAIAAGIGLGPKPVPSRSDVPDAGPPLIGTTPSKGGETPPPAKIDERPAAPASASAGDDKLAGAGAVGSTAPADRGRPPGRPGGRSARRPERAPPAANSAAAAVGSPTPAKIPTSLPPTFDPANPYR
jgi:serine/threonine protein kinase